VDPASAGYGNSSPLIVTLVLPGTPS